MHRRQSRDSALCVPVRTGWPGRGALHPVAQSEREEMKAYIVWPVAVALGPVTYLILENWGLTVFTGLAFVCAVLGGIYFEKTIGKRDD